MRGSRKSRIAGTWYPGDPTELSELLDRCLAGAPEREVPGQVVALVSPHAGLIYSGRIAAAGYRLLDGAHFDGVLLLGPCHRGGDGMTVIPGGSIETPLGTVRIDEALAAALVSAEPDVRASTECHELEHSLEVQFPFLLRFLPDVPVTPVLMGFQSPRTIVAAARAIERALSEVNRRILLIASSDLSHYEPRTVATQLDGEVVRCLERFDVAGLEDLMKANPHHACGGGPMISILAAARAMGATDAHVLAYGDSGDVNGDLGGVVGYVSAALCRAAAG